MCPIFRWDEGQVNIGEKYCLTEAACCPTEAKGGHAGGQAQLNNSVCVPSLCF